MAVIGDDLYISGADQLEEKSCLKRRISRVVLVISMVFRLFSSSVALIPVTVLCVKQTAIFVLSKLAASRILEAWCCWISLPCVMFVVVNIVIVTLGIKSGVFSSLASNESMWTPRFDQTAKIEACYFGDYRQEECHLNLEPTVEIESLNPVLCEKLQNFKCTAPSLHSMRFLLSEAEKQNFVKTSDTEMLESFSAQCRSLNSSISFPALNEKFEDSLSSSPSSIFVEVSDGKAEMDVEFEYDGRNDDKNWNADELFLKCEDFIEDFKHQLRIQRQNSLKRLHEIYTKSC